MPERLNEDIAGRLEEVARLLAAQGANHFRVGAYERAAITIRRLSRPVSDILEQQGLEGLQALPGIGESIARAIRDLLERGRLAMLDRLRGESEPTKLLASVPGIGRLSAPQRQHGARGLPDHLLRRRSEEHHVDREASSHAHHDQIRVLGRGDPQNLLIGLPKRERWLRRAPVPYVVWYQRLELMPRLQFPLSMELRRLEHASGRGFIRRPLEDVQEREARVRLLRQREREPQRASRRVREIHWT